MKKKGFLFGGLMMSTLALLAAAGCSSGGGDSASDSASASESGDTSDESSSSLVTYDGGYGSGDINITIWAADAVAESFSTQIATWANSYSSTAKVGYRVQAVGEGDAASNMITDVEAGADVYCFAQDQMARLVNAGALSTVVYDTVKTRNDPTSVTAATVGDDLYAYPLTSDNGYFMYYDKAVFPDQADGTPNAALENMSDIIAACKAADNKKIYFELSSAWYNAAYFFGAGCQSTWTTNSSGEFIDYVDDYNSDAGAAALMATYDLESEESIFVAGSSGATAFSSGAAVCVSGTWDSAAVKAILGDNFGATDLPSVNMDADGDGTAEAVHLGSFSGCKLMGVKRQSDSAVANACHSLANYLTGETCQLQRFTSAGWGPCNLEAQKDEAVLADVALTALNAQNVYATPQGQYPGDWWNLAGALPASYKAATTHDKAAATNLLKTYEASIDALKTA